MTTANSNLNLTPLSELYIMGRRADGSQIQCLNLDALKPQDVDAEVAHYERTYALRVGQVNPRTGKPLVPYGQLRGGATGGLVRGKDGIAITMFGENLDKQSAKWGGIRGLLLNWVPKHSGSAIVRPIATAAPVREIDPAERLKAIKDEEARLMALIAAREEAARAAAEAALNELAAKVARFVKLDVDTLKEVLTEAGAADFESAMEAAAAYASA